MFVDYAIFECQQKVLIMVIEERCSVPMLPNPKKMGWRMDILADFVSWTHLQLSSLILGCDRWYFNCHFFPVGVWPRPWGHSDRTRCMLNSPC